MYQTLVGAWPIDAARLVVVPRLLVGLGSDWGDTAIGLPAGGWKNVLTGADLKGGEPASLRDLLADFPVAVLARDPA